MSYPPVPSDGPSQGSFYDGYSSPKAYPQVIQWDQNAQQWDPLQNNVQQVTLTRAPSIPPTQAQPYYLQQLNDDEPSCCSCCIVM